MSDNDTTMRAHIEVALCKVLKESREDLDVSQKELGRALNLTRNQVANIESGRRAVYMADFVMIAAALKLDPARLLRCVVRRVLRLPRDPSGGVAGCICQNRGIRV